MKTHITRLGGSHYEVLVDGIDPATGLRKRLRRRIKGNRYDAEQLRLELVRLAERGSDDLTVGEYLLQWFEGHSKSIARSTAATYEAIINNHIIPAMGQIRLIDLTPRQIQQYYNGRLIKLSPRSVQQHHAVLRRALDRAHRAGQIHENPALQTDPPKPVSKTTNTLSFEETIDLLKLYKGHQYEGIYITAAFTGMRLGELLGLRWIDIDLPVVYVTQSLSRVKGVNELKPPKSSKGRGFIVPTVVAHTIESQPKYGALVFCQADGEPHDPTRVSRYFITTAKDNGYPIRLHDLRHGFATQMAMMGEHPQVVQAMLGHHDVAFTLKKYTHAFSALPNIATKLDQKWHRNGTEIKEEVEW